jgi:hypothetical protein
MEVSLVMDRGTGRVAEHEDERVAVWESGGFIAAADPGPDADPGVMRANVRVNVRPAMVRFRRLLALATRWARRP